MTLRFKQLTIPLNQDFDDSHVPRYLCEHLKIPEDALRFFSIRKKSLDARQKRRIVYHFQVDFSIDDEENLLSRHGSVLEMIAPQSDPHPLEGLKLPKGLFAHPPLIVGSGPAGIFAALVLAEAGQPAIVIERGEAVEQRFRTVNRLRRHGQFNPESNYCYGEGGAGTFSDGKLTCGRNHPLIRYLFQSWVRFGAPPDILYDAHPHMGTDNLMRIAINMRKYLVSQGTRFIFNRSLQDFKELQQGSARYRCVFDDSSALDTSHIILAIGHSARDTYKMLLSKGFAMKQKPFAMGVRLEHPQEDINKIQFGSCNYLPAAEYKLVSEQGDRGVWTFCMCPGGSLLPTGAEPGHLAINGMSYHARRSGFANAAVVVNVRREDYDQGHPLDGAKYQASIERAAFKEGGSNYHAPAQRLADFLKGCQSKGELRSSYTPGIAPGRLDLILPSFIVESLRGALKEYNKKMPGFISQHAYVIGTETKTSSPIMMPRTETLESESHPGIYPAGEGGGFAGGIVSAALDGVKVARALLLANADP